MSQPQRASAAGGRSILLVAFCCLAAMGEGVDLQAPGVTEARIAMTAADVASSVATTVHVSTATTAMIVEAAGSTVTSVLPAMIAVRDAHGWR